MLIALSLCKTDTFALRADGVCSLAELSQLASPAAGDPRDSLEAKLAEKLIMFDWKLVEKWVADHPPSEPAAPVVSPAVTAAAPAVVVAPAAVAAVTAATVGDRYNVVRDAPLRKEASKESPKTAILSAGQEIEVFESVLNAEGQVRVRCSKGWTSIVSSSGDQLLVKVGSSAAAPTAGSPPPSPTRPSPTPGVVPAEVGAAIFVAAAPAAEPVAASPVTPEVQPTVAEPAAEPAAEEAPAAEPVVVPAAAAAAEKHSAAVTLAGIKCSELTAQLKHEVFTSVADFVAYVAGVKPVFDATIDLLPGLQSGEAGQSDIVQYLAHCRQYVLGLLQEFEKTAAAQGGVFQLRIYWYDYKSAMVRLADSHSQALPWCVWQYKSPGQ
jgi:hypothetical protein